MKNNIVAISILMAISGCNSDNQNFENVQDLPVSTVEVSLKKSAELVPIRSENASPFYYEDFYDGTYVLCWVDSKHVSEGNTEGECMDLPNKEAQQPSYSLTVYGDAEFVVQSKVSRIKRSYDEFSNSIHLSGSADYIYNNGKTAITIPIANHHYAAVEVFTTENNVFPIASAEFGLAGQSNQEFLEPIKNDDITSPKHKHFRKYFLPTNDTYNLIVKLVGNEDRPLESSIEAPQVGKSYRFEVQENYENSDGIILTPNLGNLGDIDQCLGNNCNEETPIIPEESLSGANVIVETDGTINATVKEDGKRAEIKTTVESSMPLSTLRLNFNIETDLSDSFYALTLADHEGTLLYAKYTTGVDLFDENGTLIDTFDTYDEFLHSYGGLKFAQVKKTKIVKPNLVWVSHSSAATAKAGESFEVKSFNVIETTPPVLLENQFSGVTTTQNDDGSVTATVKEGLFGKTGAGKAFLFVDGLSPLSDYDLNIDIHNPRANEDIGGRHYVNIYLEKNDSEVRADVLLQKQPLEVVISDRPNHLSMADFMAEFADHKVVKRMDGLDINVNFIYRSNHSQIDGTGDTFTVIDYVNKIESK